MDFAVPVTQQLYTGPNLPHSWHRSDTLAWMHWCHTRIIPQMVSCQWPWYDFDILPGEQKKKQPLIELNVNRLGTEKNKQLDFGHQCQNILHMA